MPNYWHEWGQARKREMVDAYGGCCACCRETKLPFLSLDHIGGGGHRERLALGGQQAVMKKLKAAGWPKEGYRVLCMNCQMGTRFGRTCPHQRAALEAV
jgi:hypothetical protein